MARPLIVDDKLRWRTAGQLIRLYGEDAHLIASRRAQHVQSSDPDDTPELWRDIAEKVRMLQARPDTSREGRSVPAGAASTGTSLHHARSMCMKPYSSQIEETIHALQHCHQTCLGMAMTHCVEMGGEHARPQHLRLMMDCAQICATTADFLARKSQFHIQLCALCADVCETCAADCEKIGDMQPSVEACRACAAACRHASRPDHAEILKMASELPPS